MLVDRVPVLYKDLCKVSAATSASGRANCCWHSADCTHRTQHLPADAWLPIVVPSNSIAAEASDKAFVLALLDCSCLVQQQINLVPVLELLLAIGQTQLYRHPETSRLAVLVAPVGRSIEFRQVSLYLPFTLPPFLNGIAAAGIAALGAAPFLPDFLAIAAINAGGIFLAMIYPSCIAVSTTEPEPLAVVTRTAATGKMKLPSLLAV